MIKNFWGNGTEIEILLDDDVNFLIGANGSGKTTVLNLIASALSADLDQLQSFLFDSIEIILKEHKSNKKPKIILKKNHEDEILSYYIYQTSTTRKPDAYHFDKFDLNEYSERARRNVRMHRGLNHRTSFELSNTLNRLYRVSWLTIHRLPKHLTDERSYESTIDMKIRKISNELIRYFSALKTEADKEMMKFQEFVFLSLISSDESLEFKANKNDSQKEKKLLVDIFKQFDIKEKTYYDKVAKHFKKLEKVHKKLQNNDSLEGNEGIVVLENRRVHKVVDEWIRIKNEEKNIYKPQETF